MNSLPRLLVLIGSGELAAQMTRVHRMIVRRLVGDQAHARVRDIGVAIIDTPYGFQENADSLSAELVDYFGRRIGPNASIASFRRADDDILSRETAFATIREADFVFSGPGSPSYALRQWSGSRMADLVAEKLLHGGAVVFASAAALTLGRVAVPVYEIYKAGEDPFWMPGLDVLSAVGINAAVIPHFDNAEGGTHDTRFCYLGGRRLAMLEEQLPDETFILGVDEHTALIIDFDEETGQVLGRGGVTVQRDGSSRVIGSGENFKLADLRAGSTTGMDATTQKGPVRNARESDTSDVARRLIALDRELATIRERERLVEPLVEALLEIRRTARDGGDYATADEIRSRLVEIGIEVSDSAEGTEARLPAR